MTQYLYDEIYNSGSDIFRHPVVYSMDILISLHLLPKKAGKVHQLRGVSSLNKMLNDSNIKV